MPNSLIQRALGDRFHALHPKAQQRHSFCSADGIYSVGTGVAERIWQGHRFFWPFLQIGSSRNIMFNDQGSDIPMVIRCFAYTDGLGRETLSLNRSFAFPTPRRFDEYVVQIPDSSAFVIYVGSHQHLAVEITFSVSPQGGLVIRTHRQRLLARGFSVRFPLLFSATADVHEWYDESMGCFRIDGRVHNAIFGDIFGFKGTFTSELRPQEPGGIPPDARPVAESSRC